MSKQEQRSKSEAAEPQPKAAEVVEVKPARVNRPGFLWVATNPFCATDHMGRPSGACPIDPYDPRYYDKRRGNDIRGTVGATMIDGPVTRHASSRASGYQQTERRDVSWSFVREPFEVPDTRFYRTQIRERALLDATKDYEADRRAARARSQCVVDPRWT
jgi:hypothetical protein